MSTQTKQNRTATPQQHGHTAHTTVTQLTTPMDTTSTPKEFEF